MSKDMGIPIMKGLDTVDDMPHPISFAIMYRLRIDSFRELPTDKQPPRDLWNKPHKLEEFFDEVFERKDRKRTEFIEFDESEVE